MEKFKKLTKEEMKSVLGGMEWSGCPSVNVIDCRRNPFGLGYVELDVPPIECANGRHYLTSTERDIICSTNHYPS